MCTTTAKKCRTGICYLRCFFLRFPKMRFLSISSSVPSFFIPCSLFYSHSLFDFSHPILAKLFRMFAFFRYVIHFHISLRAFELIRVSMTVKSFKTFPPIVLFMYIHVPATCTFRDFNRFNSRARVSFTRIYSSIQYVPHTQTFHCFFAFCGEN